MKTQADQNCSLHRLIRNGIQYPSHAAYLTENPCDLSIQKVCGRSRDQKKRQQSFLVFYPCLWKIPRNSIAIASLAMLMALGNVKISFLVSIRPSFSWFIGMIL